MRLSNFFKLKSYDCNYQDMYEIQEDIKDLLDNSEKLKLVLHDNERVDYRKWSSPVFFSLIDNIYSIKYINRNYQNFWDLIFRIETNRTVPNNRLYVRICAGKDHDSDYYGEVSVTPNVKTFVDHFFTDRNEQRKIASLINQSLKDDDIVASRDENTVHHHPDFISYDCNVKNAAEMREALIDIPFEYVDNHTDLYWQPEQVREFKINFRLVDRLYWLNPRDESCLDQNTYAVIRMQRCLNTSMNPLYIVMFVRYDRDDPTQIRYSRLHFTCNIYHIVNLLDNTNTRKKVTEILYHDGEILQPYDS